MLKFIKNYFIKRQLKRQKIADAKNTIKEKSDHSLRSQSWQRAKAAKDGERRAATPFEWEDLEKYRAKEKKQES